jgi:hypothetical protein
MDSKDINKNPKSGYILPAMMILAMAGILFGLGRLAMFQIQCRLRIDRQHVIDRVLATRSALIWLKKETSFPSTTNTFVYATGSRRKINVVVRPVPSIYPDASSSSLRIADGQQGSAVFGYEADVAAEPRFESRDGEEVLVFGESALGSTGTVLVDMPEYGSWLDDVYGRRYWMHPQDLNATTNSGDFIRLVITPMGQSYTNETTPALWLQQGPERDGSDMRVRVFKRFNGETEEIYSTDIDYTYAKGLQLAASTVTLFNWYYYQGTPLYVYSDSLSVTNLMEHFVDGETNLPLRLTLEVVRNIESSNENTFSDLVVEPPYEYAIDLIWARNGKTYSEIATVVHANLGGRNEDNVVYTYDTHGTAIE